MKKKPQLIPLLDFFAETLREPLEETTRLRASTPTSSRMPSPARKSRKSLPRWAI
jgi:hypothetical protein